ncbi:MAG: YraN family protein [Parvibaculaceae bacterium]
MATLERRKAERRGHAAELAACWLLRAKGYRILARRVKTPMGEIDVIARRGPVTAFMEVKRRETHDGALIAIDRRQAARIVNAARQWTARNPQALEGSCRFDIVTVSPYLLPRHLPNAFDADISPAGAFP